MTDAAVKMIELLTSIDVTLKKLQVSDVRPTQQPTMQAPRQTSVVHPGKQSPCFTCNYRSTCVAKCDKKLEYNLLNFGNAFGGPAESTDKFHASYRRPINAPKPMFQKSKNG
jgi:hypothetical protein